MIYDWSKTEDRAQWVKDHVEFYNRYSKEHQGELAESILDAILQGAEIIEGFEFTVKSIKRIDEHGDVYLESHELYKDQYPEEESEGEVIASEDELKTYAYVVRTPIVLPYKADFYRFYLAEEYDGWTFYFKKEK